jgi:hypothetical protein
LGLREKSIQSSSIWPWLRNQCLEDGLSPRKGEKTVSASADKYLGNTELGGSNRLLLLELSESWQIEG